MQDRFEVGIQHLDDVVDVAAAVEEVADVELLQVFVTVELLVVGVGDGIEFRLVVRVQHRLRVATEIGAGHCLQVDFVARHQLADVLAQPIVRIRGNVVELVHRDQALVEDFRPELLHSEAERRVGADQRLVVAFKKRLHRVHLPAVVRSRRIAEVPFRLHLPIGEEAELAERLVVKARADRALRHHDDRLLESLVFQLVQRDEHQRPALARGRRRLDEQILLAALLIGALLHRPHAHRVRAGGAAVAGVGDGDGGDGFGACHVQGAEGSDSASSCPNDR